MAAAPKPNNKRTKRQTAAYTEFLFRFTPVEEQVHILTDERTGACYIECHVIASKLVALGTIDVPLDPEDQSEYRANRDVVEDSSAFEIMRRDAVLRRSFSNIVTEYKTDFDPNHPLKIIGGQHRFIAISEALEGGIDEYHGVKVYLDLTVDQRLDVQIISNTNIATSRDLLDRMLETVQGPELRDWCQSVGLLQVGVDFADSRTRYGPISVQLARSFITNFYRGQEIDPKKFDQSDTHAILCPTGARDPAWEALKAKTQFWKDSALREAAVQFAGLSAAQRVAFQGTRAPADQPEKAMNAAVLASWAMVAGMLQRNSVRLSRHYALADVKGRDPLNAPVLAKGRHRSDPPSYRGLGYRTDRKERGRLVELFALQAEEGKGVNASNVDIAIRKYHAKLAILDVQAAQEKAGKKDC